MPRFGQFRQRLGSICAASDAELDEFGHVDPPAS
jgi:hypothetical protein